MQAYLRATLFFSGLSTAAFICRNLFVPEIAVNLAVWQRQVAYVLLSIEYTAYFGLAIVLVIGLIGACRKILPAEATDRRG